MTFWRLAGAVSVGLFALASASCVAEKTEIPERPNILWIIAEDLGPELGSYGHPEAYTPHLDRLAAEGVRYTRAYTVAPVCSVSRSGFMTGMHPVAIDAHNHTSHRTAGENPLPEGVRVLPHWLKDAGYFTANLGDEMEGIPGSRKDGFNFSLSGPVWDSDRWAHVVAHEPLYAQNSFNTPHRTYRPPGTRSRIAPPANPAKVRIPPYYPDHEIARRDWAEYLDVIQEMD